MRQILKKGFFENVCILVFMIISSFSQAQLTDFSLSVAKTDETCESNGSLTFSVQNATLQAIITYSIYVLPDLVNPLTITTQNNYAGLNSGNYLVVATQNLNGLSNSQQQFITILDQVVPLEYQLQGQNAVCINNGKITVTISQGVAATFEIISGPMLKPLQTSNVFTGLSAGIYVVRVFDICGNGVVQTFTLFESPSSINISPVNTITVIDCNSAIINQTISAGEGVIFYPLNLVYTVVFPNGQANVVTQTLTSGNDNFITIAQNIPISIGQSLTYTLNILDGCGSVFNISGNLSVPTTEPDLQTVPNGCGINNYIVKKATNVSVIEAPSGFVFGLPYNVASSGNNEFPLNSFPIGNYKLAVTDLCGQVLIIEFSVAPSNVAPPTILVRLGCQNGLGSIKISGEVNIVSAQITQAPANSGFVVPSDVSALLYGTPQGIHINNLIAGVYGFSIVDQCGTSYNLTSTIQSYQEVTTVNVTENCGSFDLFLNHSTTPVVLMSYQLEKFFPTGNYWGHPITGLQGSGVPLVNNATQYNIASSGNFRIVGKNFIYGNGNTSVNCVIILDEFEFYSLPKINNVYSFACDEGGFDVFVAAVGVSALKYKIIAKNGVPIFINNLTNPLFTDLAAGIYTFQLEDGCSNILVADFEVGSTQDFPVLGENLCPQLNATLSVADFYFLNYQWWKGNDSATILSTASSLNIPNFNPITDSGLYHVRIYYSASPNSCIDIQSDYSIGVSDYILNAGESTIVQYCDNPGIIDLFTILNGNPDLNGTWQELSSSGSLNGSVWNSNSVANGTYNFKYTVTGLCSITDSALIQIKVNVVPANVAIGVNPIACLGETIEFSTNFIENATYFWQGPNNFSSTLQNPMIENATISNTGNYSLVTTLGECDSEPVFATVDVKVMPEFSVTGSCVKEDSDYELQVLPVEGNISLSDFTYSWNSAAGYLGSENPISILGKESGIYTVTITDNLGCFQTLSYEVKGTVCRIPKGISPNNDGDNDSFNLAGFDVKNLIIYSRYGRLVYEKENYINEWIGQDFKGRDLPDATYFYHIETYAGEEFVGWVYKIN